MLLFSCMVMSDSLRPHGLQHARLPRPSLSPWVCSNSCIPLFKYLQHYSPGEERNGTWKEHLVIIQAGILHYGIFLWNVTMNRVIRMCAQSRSWYWMGLFMEKAMAAQLQCSCLENPMDGGAWRTAVHGVAEGWTWLSDFTFTFHFHALEKEMATHSSVLAWRIPGTGEPSGLPSLGWHRVGHDWSDLAVCIASR